MAEYLSLGPVDPNTAMWMRDAASRDRMPRIKELERPEVLPVSLGPGALGLRHRALGRPCRGLAAAVGIGDAATLEGALTRATGLKSDELSAQWQAALRETAAAVRQRTRPVTDFGRVLEKGQSEIRGPQRLAGHQPGRPPHDVPLAALAVVGRPVPRRRPDGQGPAGRSPTPRSTRTSAAWSSSTRPGAWAPDSRRFAFSVVRGGHPALVILDVDRTAPRRSAKFPDLGRDLQPDLVARRAVHRLLGAAGRPDRPLRLRHAGGHHAPPHQRRVCRPAARVVARRPVARLRDRPVLDAPRDARHRELPARHHGRRRPARSGRWPAPRRGRTSTRSGRPTGASSSSPIATASATSTGPRPTAWVRPR